ncbi:MAG: MFS transporter [Candidatus Coatesbacteria bacterium]|nr:MFS transporter [Candidatus Coatesbacteria bacterium]
MASDSEKSLRHAALLIAVISAFMIPFVSNAVMISLPTIGREFHSDTILLAWVRTAYLITAAVFLMPFGRIADIMGRKKIMRIGIAIYTLASTLCAVSSSVEMLIGARALQGFGASMVFGTAVAIVTSVYPADMRGKALGIRSAFVFLGISCGPSIGGFISQYFGWRSIFFINMGLGLIILALMTWRLPGEWAGAKGEKFDTRGAFVCSASLLLAIYGILNLVRSWGPLLLLAGLGGLIVFGWLEARTPSPLFDISLFTRNRVFLFSNLTALIIYIAIAARTFMLSFYLQEIRGLDQLWAGLVMLAQPAVQVVLSPVAGWLSDKKFEPRHIASLGMAFVTVALVLLAMLDSATPISYVAVSLALLGCGIAMFSSPNTNAIMGSVSNRSYSIASATQSTVIILGMNLSMGIVMLLLTVHVGEVQLSPEHHAGFMTALRISFGMFAGLCAIGIATSLARGKSRKSAADLAPTRD